MLEKTLLDSLLRRFKHGTIVVHYWDGTTTTYGSSLPEVTLTIASPKVIRGIMRNISLGTGEAYVDGSLEIEPVDAFFEITSLNQPYFSQILEKMNLFTHPQPNRKGGQRKQIQHHYDLGNDFYRLWLDKETMAYTCAYFRTATDTLERAQIQKFDHVLRKLQLKPGMSVLELGCGWGHLLIHAAKYYGISGLGVTLSAEQFAYAQDMAKKEGVDGQIRFELRNYQDTVSDGVLYDRVYSVGLLEHVGSGNTTNYFDVVKKTLKPGGLSLMHCITNQYDHRQTDPWIAKYIFPGGHLLTVGQITTILAQKDLRLLDVENLRPHYALTLDEWRRRFESHKSAVIKKFDERFYRMWRFYLAGSSGGFRYGELDLTQVVFSNGINNELPLTREHIYPPPLTTPKPHTKSKVAPATQSINAKLRRPNTKIAT